MPDEPNQKMDELLRTYAEERRKSAGDMTVHPVTRQMLQREVSQVFGSPPPSAQWYHRLRSFWPQIAFAGSLCVVLGIAVLSLRQPSPPEDVNRQLEQPLKKSEPASRDALGSAVELKTKPSEKAQSVFSGEAAAPGGPETDAMLQSAPPEETLQRQRFLSGKVSPSAAEVPQLEKAQADELKEEREQIRTPLMDARSAQAEDPAPSKRTASRSAAPAPTERRIGLQPTAAAPPAPTVQQQTAARQSTAVTAAEKDVGQSELSNLGAARRLTFVQVANTEARTSATKPAEASVLSTFHVEQTGTDLQFYDQDGSVYRGSMKPVEANATLSTVKLDVNGDHELLQNPAVYQFNVQGSNRTYARELVLSGQFLSETNVQPSALDTFAIAPDAKEKEQAPVRHVIIGNATIGNTNQVPVRAISR